jgi:hypothetical protein
MTDISSLRVLAEKATPGPWRLRDAGSTLVSVQGAPEAGQLYGEMVTISSGGFAKPRGYGADNAAFIAAANPSAILAMIDRIEAMEKALQPFADFATEAERFVEEAARDGSSPIMPTNHFRLAHFRDALTALNLGAAT